VDSNDYNDIGLSNGTTYYYVVTAFDTYDNESADSSEASATPQNLNPPAAPTGLAATAGNTQVSLDWDDNTEGDFADYSVWRSTTSGGSYTEVASGLTTSAYTNTGLTNGTTYYYVVTAFDTADNESDDSMPWLIITTRLPTTEAIRTWPSEVMGPVRAGIRS
jgi:fibronectin type 3 domain-containing protein